MSDRPTPAVPTPAALQPAVGEAAERLQQMLQVLRTAAAARAGRYRYIAPLVLLVCTYLVRVSRRFDRLVARLAEGEIYQPRQRPAATSPAGPHSDRQHSQRRDGPKRKPGLPRLQAWLIQLVPEAASTGSQLRTLLGEPEMRRLVQADPRFGRLLRPLCWALAIRPSPDVPAALFPPPVPRTARPPSPAEPAPPSAPRRVRPRLRPAGSAAAGPVHRLGTCRASPGSVAKPA